MRTCGLPTIKVRTNSSMLPMNVNTPPANNPGTTSGMSTRHARLNGPAPRLRAASIKSWGTASNVAVTMRIMNGRTTTVWTRMTPSTVCARPNRMNIDPRPVAITIPGMMIGASTRNSIARRNGTARRPSAKPVGRASAAHNAVTRGAIVKLATAASPISGTENIARQLSNDRLGGTRFGGNQPARGLTSDQRTPTIIGTIRPISVRPKNNAATSHGPERPGNNRVPIIEPGSPAPARADSTRTARWRRQS